MFSGPSVLSVRASLERERAAQPVRAATRASSIPFTSRGPNPHKSWAGSNLVICTQQVGRGLVSLFVADSRQSVAKYQQGKASPARGCCALVSLVRKRRLVYILRHAALAQLGERLVCNQYVAVRSLYAPLELSPAGLTARSPFGPVLVRVDRGSGPSTGRLAGWNFILLQQRLLG
jgi:hypothetical protein